LLRTESGYCTARARSRLRSTVRSDRTRWRAVAASSACPRIESESYSPRSVFRPRAKRW
jgi:hypothetical protein